MENLSSNFWIIPLYLLSNLSFLFNLVCTPCTPLLLEAQRHPEEHKDLVVRVAGYSAQFTVLAKEVQDDIISRTEQSF